jgi:trk system potassium uptake protein
MAMPGVPVPPPHAMRPKHPYSGMVGVPEASHNADPLANPCGGQVGGHATPCGSGCDRVDREVYNESVSLSPTREDESSSLKPPHASIPPPLVPPRSVAPSAAGPAPSRRTPDPMRLLAATIAITGAVDFIIPLLAWASIPLSVILTILVVPWAVLVVREATGDDDDRARAKRRFVFHFANTALVLTFLGAKWLTLIDALGEASPRVLLPAHRNYTLALVVLLLAGALLRGNRVVRFVAAGAEHPARLMAGSFGLVSAVGGLLLALPFSLRDPSSASLVDAMFVATSAVCVTGLSTVDVPQTYTTAGQGVICALIQVGGLGIMVITAAITMLAGKRLSVKGAAAVAEVVDSGSISDVRRTVSMIVSYTILLEAIGAGLLYVQLKGVPKLPGEASSTWSAVFHAISAFCNAGFSIFDGGMAPFVGSPGICGTIGALVVLGGLGFPVVHELLFRWTHMLGRRRPPRVTLNTRVALATTALLLAAMTTAYLALENRSSFRELGPLERLNAAVFQSVSARTAGFNVVDVGAMHPASLLLTSLAMFVGAGSGSIAGGIKITTVAVLFAAFRGEIRAQPPQLFDRRIPDAVVRRAIGVAFLATIVVLVIVLVLLVVERHEPLAIVFEVVSAFSTTGLSTGITPHLGIAAKLVLILTMLVGRIGPLTAAVALSARLRDRHYQLAEERVMIG